MPKVKKSAPRKIKTLIPEPNWEKLSKITDEEKRLEAFSKCLDFAHFEVSDKDCIASLKIWIRKISGWDAHEESKIIPDTFLQPFAKYGFVAVKLGYTPQKIEQSLEDNLKPLLLKSTDLRSRVVVEPLIHPSVEALDKDHYLHKDKVVEWLVTAKAYVSANKKDVDSKDPKKRMDLMSAETYVSNIRSYLKTGVWSDMFYGENRQHKTMWVCLEPAYDKDGLIKRNKGTFYPDVGVWQGDISDET